MASLAVGLMWKVSTNEGSRVLVCFGFCDEIVIDGQCEVQEVDLFG